MTRERVRIFIGRENDLVPFGISLHTCRQSRVLFDLPPEDLKFLDQKQINIINL